MIFTENNEIKENQLVKISENKNNTLTTDSIINEVRTNLPEGEGYQQQLNRLVDLFVTQEAMDQNSEENNSFLKELNKIKKEQLKQEFLSQLIDSKNKKTKSQTVQIENKRKRCEAFYASFRPILEFDLSAFMPKKNQRKNVLEEKNTEEKKPEYADRSYGMILMLSMLIILAPFYGVAILGLCMFNIINAFLTAINQFGKLGFITCLTIFFVAFLIIFSYIGIITVEGLFGINILP